MYTNSNWLTMLFHYKFLVCFKKYADILNIKRNIDINILEWNLQKSHNTDCVLRHSQTVTIANPIIYFILIYI